LQKLKLPNVKAKINCANIIFSVTGNELECFNKNLKGKLSAGFGKIPQNIFKQCNNTSKSIYLIFVILLQNLALSRQVENSFIKTSL